MLYIVEKLEDIGHCLSMLDRTDYALILSQFKCEQGNSKLNRMQAALCFSNMNCGRYKHIETSIL